MPKIQLSGFTGRNGERAERAQVHGPPRQAEETMGMPKGLIRSEADVLAVEWRRASAGGTVPSADRMALFRPAELCKSQRLCALAVRYFLRSKKKHSNVKQLSCFCPILHHCPVQGARRRNSASGPRAKRGFLFSVEGSALRSFSLPLPPAGTACLFEAQGREGEEGKKRAIKEQERFDRRCRENREALPAES